ncbi:pleckstrin homology domain-containing family M member 3 isoform X2 [Narcine bancroftii]|uniref:pleckstrin homology domain-containing family M member 3 isoform X2 n=1 Tax=Narcine bancroftii TaxID=1343680 RepID=UPI003832057D
MEALEADDISPALEATEEFFLFSGIYDQMGHAELPKQEVYGIQEIPVVIGHEILKVRNDKLHPIDGTRIAVQNPSLFETTTQVEMRKNALASKSVGVASGPKQQWADGSASVSSFTSDGYSAIRTRKSNSTEGGPTNKTLLFRSQSNVNPPHSQLQPSSASVHHLLDLKFPPSSTATSLDKDRDFATTTRTKDDPRRPSRMVLKKGNLALRQDRAGMWKESYVELRPRELCLYSVEPGNDCHLRSVYYLSCCQSIALSATSGGRILEILFSNGACLQLQADSIREAEDWRQNLLERTRALYRPQTLAFPIETREATLPSRHPGTCQAEQIQPQALPLPTEGTVRIGLLHKMESQDHWNSYTFVLGQKELQYFRTNDLVEKPLMSYKINRCLSIQLDTKVGSAARLKVAFPEEVLTLMADTQQELQEWMEAIKAVTDCLQESSGLDRFSSKHVWAEETNSEGVETRRNKRYSVTSSFLSLLTVIAVEKGLTAQSFRCAGCRKPVGLSYGIAKVCAYSGWYYCQACHVDDLFLIPARLVHNWDTTKHKCDSSLLLMGPTTIASSANLLTLLEQDLMMPSWVGSMNRSGLSTQPQGAPLLHVTDPDRLQPFH